ncbi:MAG: hypothetical protein ACAI25_12260 [Planctomycetota bacterium]
MKLSRLATREKVLLAFAATFVPAVFVLLYPVLDRRAELAKKSGERDKLEVAAGQKPSTDAELARLTARRAALRETIDKDKKALAVLAASFPRNSAKALEGVSALAAELGVLIRESQPVAPLADDAMPRPRRRFTVVASFAALRALVAALPALRDGPVHVEELSIDTVALPNDIESGGEGNYALVATLVLVL